MCRGSGTRLVYNRDVRVIVFALLLANLLFMGWAKWIDVPAPPAPSSIAGLKRLTLVSELPADKRAALASKMSSETPAPPQCVSVGPFDDLRIVAQAAALLQAKSFAPQQRTAESPAVRRLWVYLEGFKSDAAEMRVLHRLERAGIDDAEAMPVAAGGRRVSLGLFTDGKLAEKRVKAVRAMGFKPAMTERMLPGTVYWLDLTLPSGSAPLPLKDISALEPGSGGGGSSISVQTCPSAPPTAVPSPQQGAPASSPATPPAAGPQAAAPAAPSSPVLTLPRCKPGGVVPCVATDPETTTDPSVF